MSCSMCPGHDGKRATHEHKRHTTYLFQVAIEAEMCVQGLLLAIGQQRLLGIRCRGLYPKGKDWTRVKKRN